jgi:hypothetical protein
VHDTYYLVSESILGRTLLRSSALRIDDRSELLLLPEAEDMKIPDSIIIGGIKEVLMNPERG